MIGDMKKKLDTRFPAARIKKIMQADEDVGKIAMAVPLLVSKALELFLQDLCDRTYEITLKRGAKTLNSLHLKQCVQTFNVFDFLREIVSKVPDLGGTDTAGEEHSVAKRRKVDDEDTDEEYKTSRMHETFHGSVSGRGRGKGRGRGRGRSSRTVVRAMSAHYEKSEDDQDNSDHQEKHNASLKRLSGHEEAAEAKDDTQTGNTEMPVRNFDLNVDLDENGDSKDMPVSSQASLTMKITPTEKHEEYPGWSLTDVEKVAMDHFELANISRRIDEDEDEEDYDEEES